MDLNASRAEILRIFGRTTWIDKCLTLFDHVTSPGQNPDRKYGYNDIALITENDGVSAELIGMTNALVSSGVLDCGASFVDEAGEVFEITGEPLELLWNKNKLAHPKTGKAVAEPQNKTHMFFRIRPEVADVMTLRAPTP